MVVPYKVIQFYAYAQLDCNNKLNIYIYIMSYNIDLNYKYNIYV